MLARDRSRLADARKRYPALRRGLLMEELAKSLHDSDAKDEMFICGLFSLLDCLLAQPIDVLMKSIPVPQDVVDALASGTGPNGQMSG